MSARANASPMVLKFGGSTFEPIENLLAVAEYVSDFARLGRQLILCVSAPAGVTEQQCQYVERLSGRVRSRGIDSMSTLSDLIGAHVMSHALDQLGVSHEVLAGNRIGVYTDGTVGAAEIVEMRPAVIARALERQDVLIIPGGQASRINDPHALAWFGKNSSDFSAVLLASLAGATECQIHSDVSHVYSADPNRISGSVPISSLDYSSLRLIARLGAKVIHPRAVELAQLHGIEIFTALNRPPFTLGTRVADIEDTADEFVVTNERTVKLRFASSRHFSRAVQSLRQHNVDVLDASLVPELDTLEVLIANAYVDPSASLPDDIDVEDVQWGTWEHCVRGQQVLGSRILEDSELIAVVETA